MGWHDCLPILETRKEKPGEAKYNLTQFWTWCICGVFKTSAWILIYCLVQRQLAGDTDLRSLANLWCDELFLGNAKDDNWVAPEFEGWVEEEGVNFLYSTSILLFFSPAPTPTLYYSWLSSIRHFPFPPVHLASELASWPLLFVGHLLPKFRGEPSYEFSSTTGGLYRGRLKGEGQRSRHIISLTCLAPSRFLGFEEEATIN